MSCSGSHEARYRQEDTTHTARRSDDTGRPLSEQKRRRVHPRRGKQELGARPSEISQKTLWKARRASYGMCRWRHLLDVWFARAKAWMCTWRHVDSRTWTVLQIERNLHDCGTWGTVDVRATALGCPGETRGCTRGVLCNKEQTTSQIKNVSCHSTADLTNPWHKQTKSLFNLCVKCKLKYWIFSPIINI